MQTGQEELQRLNAGLVSQLQGLQIENKQLKQKVQFLLLRMFGRKSEKIDPRQLELLLKGLAVEDPPPDNDPPPSPPSPPRKPRETGFPPTCRRKTK